MILNAVEELITHTGGKIQVLVGGPADHSDPYAAGCARHAFDLRRRFPWCFWADPDGFFTDGPLVNLGSDFGVMVSFVRMQALLVTIGSALPSELLRLLYITFCLWLSGVSSIFSRVYSSRVRSLALTGVIRRHIRVQSIFANSAARLTWLRNLFWIYFSGGIVQQEFFVAGTPVIAFRTGGLKDTVHEWSKDEMYVIDLECANLTFLLCVISLSF